MGNPIWNVLRCNNMDKAQMTDYSQTVVDYEFQIKILKRFM